LHYNLGLVQGLSKVGERRGGGQCRGGEAEVEEGWIYKGGDEGN